MAWQRGQSYGQLLRDRMLGAEGSIHELAERFAVSDSYVARVRSKRRRLDQDTPGMQCNHVPLCFAGVEQAVLVKVEAQPDHTLSQ